MIIEDAVEDLLVGNPPFRQRPVESDPGGASLMAQQQRAEQSVEEQEGERGTRPDRLADLDDHVELRDRHENEDHDQKEHGRKATQARPLSFWSMATETTTEEDVYEALEEVIDPELGLDFVSLGLVYDVEIEKEEAFITFTLTTPACPIGPQVSEQMREFVGQLQGIDKVHPKMVFDPPWSPEMMSEDAKFALGLLTSDSGSGRFLPGHSRTHAVPMAVPTRALRRRDSTP